MFQENAKWESDAGNISNYDGFDTMVYRNGSVNSFLNDSNRTFVIAAKGMGKTLLLSYKRYLLQEKYKSSIIFIPNQHPYISFVESIKYTLSNEHIEKLKKWEYCKRFWELVIELCAISYINEAASCFIDSLPARCIRYKSLLKELVSQPNSIEFIFNELIPISESVLSKLIDEISNHVEKCFKNISKGTIIFFDRFDNALESSHDDIWTPIQVGLLEAAWDIMRSNRHIKIYLSIRQEAFAAHTSRNLNAISSSVAKIEYSKTELKELVNHLVYYYEGYDSIESFLGFKEFPNTITFQEEDVFDFMYRYSIGRPRDFVQFCGELSMHKESQDDFEQKRYYLKERIRIVSSKTIINSLYDELKMLLKCLTTLDDFKEFLLLLRHNILTYNDLKSICKEYNGVQCNEDCSSCTLEKHPFCDLFNMGLLGFVENHQYGENQIQKFKTPYENLTRGLRGNVNYFLIHPALREYINFLHRTSPLEINYTLFKGILIGADLPWTSADTDLYHVNRMIYDIADSETMPLFDELLKNHLQNKENNFGILESIKKESKYPLYKQKIMDAIISYFESGSYTIPKEISIFVSYAYDSDEHKEKVESFVNMLRKMGFNAEMDSMLKNDYPDIDQMMTYGLEHDKIIIVLSPEYKRKADNSIGGVWKEFKMIAKDLEQHPQKYIFVSFIGITDKIIEKITPTRIGNRWIVDLEKGKKDNYNELIAFIKEEKEYPFSPVNPNAVKTRLKTIKPF